jgi:hypothetical protein
MKEPLWKRILAAALLFAPFLLVLWGLVHWLATGQRPFST